MNLDQIMKAAENIPVFEDRSASATYIELVFETTEVSKWDSVLSKFLGAAAKTAGSKPSNDQSALTRPFGGVYKDQTLYYLKSSDAEIIAMFWPWQNGLQITLKLAKVR